MDKQETRGTFGPPRTVETAAEIELVGSLAKNAYESRYFRDIQSTAQAGIKIMAGRELGLGPVAALIGLHIIDGKIELSANLIAARIRESGRYDYKVREVGEAGCTIEFYEDGEAVGKVSFTEADRVRANLGMRDGARDPYSPWTKYPANMMFARALSTGARFYCPDVFYGVPVYVPGEIGAMTDEEADAYFNPDMTDEEIRQAREAVSSTVTAEAPSFADETVTVQLHDDTDEGEVVEEEAPCPACGGSKANADGEPCPTCDGAGVVPASWVEADEGATEETEPTEEQQRSELIVLLCEKFQGTERKVVNRHNKRVSGNVRDIAEVSTEDLLALLNEPD